MNKYRALIPRSFGSAYNCVPPSSLGTTRLGKKRPLDSIKRNNKRSYQNVQLVRSFSSINGPNPGLASVVAQGIKSLEGTAADIAARTKNIALDKKEEEDTATSPRLLAESHRISDTVTECLDDLCERNQGGMSAGGEPISVLDVQVNSNARQAKVYWTLPYGVLVDKRLNRRIYDSLMARIQDQINAENGGKLLSREVHNRLSSYYPPKVKLVRATDEMVQIALEELKE